MADKLIMKDGRVFEGKIVEETDTTVKIKMAKGTIPFPKDQIEKIERGDKLGRRAGGETGGPVPVQPRGLRGPGANGAWNRKWADDPRSLSASRTSAWDSTGRCAAGGNAAPGDIAAAKSDRGEAAECYRQAFMADWKNPEIRRKFLEYRGGLEGAVEEGRWANSRDALSTGDRRKAGRRASA